jgi:hypothetical protein
MEEWTEGAHVFISSERMETIVVGGMFGTVGANSFIETGCSTKQHE